MGIRSGLTGLQGEEIAARHLQARGYRILARRFRTPAGELDLVAQSPGGLLVFVEVKTRSTPGLAGPLDSVHPIKQRRIARAAERYLQATGRHDAFCRFDVITLTGEAGSGSGPRIEHLEDAFRPEA